MQWSRKAMLRNECQFDSFAKKVMRNFARNWFRKRQWRSTKEIIIAELPVGTQPEPLHTDWHEGEDMYFFYDLGQPMKLKMMHWRGRYVLSRRVSAKLCCYPIFADQLITDWC